MPIFSVQQAKDQLPRLLAQVEKGEEVVIARGGEPVARIVPFDTAKPRRPGALKGKVALTPAFFEPLSLDDIEAWGGNDESAALQDTAMKVFPEAASGTTTPTTPKGTM